MKLIGKTSLILTLIAAIFAIFCCGSNSCNAEIRKDRSAMLLDAVEQVKNHRLNSGRTIEEELNLFLPGIGREKRIWKSHFVSDASNSQIVVKYIIKPSNIFRFNNLEMQWDVYYDDKGAFKYISGGSGIAFFMQISDECERREKVLSEFSSEDQKIFLYLYEKFDKQLTGKAWAEYRSSVLNDASGKFGKPAKVLDEIYAKVRRKMFGN